MRPSGAVVQQPEAGLPLPLALDSFSDPFLGSPIAFAQCAMIPGSDASMTLPVYAISSGTAYMMGRLLDLNSGPTIWPGLRILLEKGRLMLSLLRSIRRIALWSRRDCRVVHIGLRLITGRHSPI